MHMRYVACLLLQQCVWLFIGSSAFAQTAQWNETIWLNTKLGPIQFIAEALPTLTTPLANVAMPLFANESQGQSEQSQFYLLALANGETVQATLPEQVSAQGVLVVGHLDNHAWLVQATTRQLAQLQATIPQLATMPLPLALKVDPSLLRQQASQQWQLAIVDTSSEVIDIVMELYGSEPERLLAPFAQQISLQSRITASSKQQSTTIVHLQLASSMLPTLLLAIPQILYIEPYVPQGLFNAIENNFVQAGRNNPIATPIWQQNIHGEGQVVAVADSALDESSCFFDSSRVTVQNVLGLPRPTLAESYSHGTHVAGTVLGKNKNIATIGEEDGVAPAASLIFQPLAHPTIVRALVPPSDLAEIFQPAYDANARIHTNSWGSAGNRSTLTSKSIDAFVHLHPDFLVLFAAGNSGRDRNTGVTIFGSVGSPGTAKNVITVGALDTAPFTSIAPFSSRGPTLDGRIKPTLMAPGSNVMSAASGSTCGLVALSGTSMATPLVAGAATLVRGYFSKGYYPTGSMQADDAFQPSAALLKATLLAAAQALPNGNYTLGDMQQGFGGLGLDQALAFQERLGMLWVQDNVRTVSTGAIETVSFALRPGNLLRIALTWTDPPALAAAPIELVNNLDLRLTAPDGTVYLGNVFRQQFSLAGGMADALNVEEVISINNASDGLYRLEVIGQQIPMGPQAFAVAMIGDFAIPPTQTKAIPETAQLMVPNQASKKPLQANNKQAINMQTNNKQANFVQATKSFVPQAYPTGCQQMVGGLESLVVALLWLLHRSSRRIGAQNTSSKQTQ